MRRKDREVKDISKILQVIDQCDILHLGMIDEGYAYVVPVNFGYCVKNGQIDLYFHGAMAGKKYELLKENPNCSFEMEHALGLEFLPDSKDVTMRYECVMGKGQVTFLAGEEKEAALDAYIMGRYEETRSFDYDRSCMKRTMVARLRVSELSCKINPKSIQ